MATKKTRKSRLREPIKKDLKDLLSRAMLYESLIPVNEFLKAVLLQVETEEFEDVVTDEGYDLLTYTIHDLEHLIKSLKSE